MNQPSTRRELLSVDDYAARTGISPTEIRRQIRAGTLPAETFQRPQGTFYRVIVDTPAPAESIESVQAPSTSQEPPAATQALVETIASLVERNADLSDRVAALSERAGRAEERATGLAAERDELQRRLDAAAARRPWWRFWRD